MTKILRSFFVIFHSEIDLKAFFLSSAGLYKVEGGNKIKRFGDGEKNQKLEKKKKENF